MEDYELDYEELEAAKPSTARRKLMNFTLGSPLICQRTTDIESMIGAASSFWYRKNAPKAYDSSRSKTLL